MTEFTAFPVPLTSDDIPLVQHAGVDYVCTGCSGHIPSGVWIRETVRDGMVVGLRVTNGGDGELIHRCGEVDDDG